jgi:hypothetical protein
MTVWSEPCPVASVSELPSTVPRTPCPVHRRVTPLTCDEGAQSEQQRDGPRGYDPHSGRAGGESPTPTDEHAPDLIPAFGKIRRGDSSNVLTRHASRSLTVDGGLLGKLFPHAFISRRAASHAGAAVCPGSRVAAIAAGSRVVFGGMRPARRVF